MIHLCVENLTFPIKYGLSIKMLTTLNSRVVQCRIFFSKMVWNLFATIKKKNNHLIYFKIIVSHHISFTSSGFISK